MAAGSGDKAAPNVVLGMHRSGTSLVAGLLEGAGVFMGADLDSHGESRSLRELNRFVLRVGHADWDFPLGVRYLLEAPELCDELVRHLSAAVEGEELREAYLGRPARRWGRARSQWPGRWGWKDPRNTLTLPLWRRVFPGLRAFHVVRNGIDVANSLVERERKRARKGVDRLDHPARSVRCLSQPRAFELWTEYVAAGLEALGELPEAQALTIVYEDLLSSPREQIERLFRFAELEVADREIESLAASIDDSRAFAFRKQQVGADPGQVDHELMRRMGYGSSA